MMIMTTIINALLLVDVCKIRKIRKTSKVRNVIVQCDNISFFCHFHFNVKLILGGYRNIKITILTISRVLNCNFNEFVQLYKG